MLLLLCGYACLFHAALNADCYQQQPQQSGQPIQAISLPVGVASPPGAGSCDGVSDLGVCPLMVGVPAAAAACGGAC